MRKMASHRCDSASSGDNSGKTRAAQAGVASSKLAAKVAASAIRKDGGPSIVSEGQEAAFLAPLPLSRLSPELDLAETLARWGLRSIGELARLPASEVASRLGSEGHRLHAVARGLDPQPLVPRQPHQAVYWFDKAARQDDVGGLYWLAEA